MTNIDRRSMLKGAAGLGLTAALPDAIKAALAVEPHRETGTIQDVQHIVVLMQENRPFDQYFGKLKGVRGFSDPRAVKLPNGNPVWAQPSGTTSVLPYNPPGADAGMAFYQDVDHGWNDSHQAWNNGKYDAWIPAKGPASMIYFQRNQIPFHYAIADAFTVCDSYFCSVMSSTDPNRYYAWTGWLGQGGSNPDSPTSGATPGTITLRDNGNGTLPYGPVINNEEAGYSWKSYPERLSAAGVSWKVYQDQGAGLTANQYWGWGSNPYIGNYGDNSLLYLLQYQNAAPGSALYQGALTGTDIKSKGYDGEALFEQLRADVKNDRLPQVSYIAAPESFSEHPNWPVNYGAWYFSKVLDALTANPEVWAKTVLIYTFDEAGGFFDHVVPPVPPMHAGQGKSTVSTVNEIHPGTAEKVAGPYGLGTRVPTVIVSPWSKGGWVCSEVFDHTSIIRFIEKRFGVQEPNISPWRRSVCGDLTSALDFTKPSTQGVRLPGVAAYAAPQADMANSQLYPNAPLTVPTPGVMPTQEPGLRRARPLPYRLHVDRPAQGAGNTLALNFANAGQAGACLHVRSGNGSTAGGSTGPWSYTVEAARSLGDTWTGQGANGALDLSVYGPNGYFRRFAGRTDAQSANLSVRLVEHAATGGVSVVVTNAGSKATIVSVTDKYSNSTSHQKLEPGAKFRSDWSLQLSRGWYDLVVSASTDASHLTQLAGHVETGQAGVSDPLLGSMQTTPEGAEATASSRS
jgi:phospholipase C